MICNLRHVLDSKAKIWINLRRISAVSGQTRINSESLIRMRARARVLSLSTSYRNFRSTVSDDATFVRVCTRARVIRLQ